MRFATSGEDALEQLDSKPADVVVTDVRMMGIDGLALLRTISTRYPRMIRIVLSGSLTNREPELEEIAHEILTKPSNGAALAGAVARHLAGRRLAEASGGV